ncbi:hypothetical protein HanPI659440_Chr11g0430721 [Helianthus annuus]|nr:hypothetical protein HanPI659440_Chr11g0430721 [Helianthus annuus]
MDHYEGMKKRTFGWSIEWNHQFHKAFHSLKIIPSTDRYILGKQFARLELGLANEISY